MVDTSTLSAPATSLVCRTMDAEPLRPIAAVRHNASYVTQLMANAADLPNMPQRRKSDRAGPLAAYAPCSPRGGRTRLIA